jgi:acylphosphatase
MPRYTIHFSGHVQGVGFRYTTVRVAEGHAVAGYVRNLPDGRVELVAEGGKDHLDAFLADILRQMGRHVTRHTIDESPANGQFGEPGVEPLTIRY